MSTASEFDKTGMSPTQIENETKRRQARISAGLPPENPKPAADVGRGNFVNDVDLRTLENLSAENEKYRSRFEQLVEFQKKNLTSSEVKNMGFESGRPPAKLSDKLKGDKADMFTRPSLDALYALNLKVESVAIATAEDFAKISAKIQGMGWPAEEMAPLFWRIARQCVDNSSSQYLDPNGTFEVQGCTLTKDAVLAIIKDQVTLRAFCRAFAPVMWNQMISNKMPPQNWQKKGYTENTKYAAFDTFDYVLNQAAIQPLEGLIRVPTPEEHLAANVNRRLAINGSRRNSRYASYNSEITGGLNGRDVVTDFSTANSTD